MPYLPCPTPCLRKLLLLGLLFVLPLRGEFVGELEFHRFLWEANSNYQVEFNRLNQNLQEVENRFFFERNILQREIRDLNQTRAEGLRVNRDEFETSEQYAARRERLQARFMVESEQRLIELNQQLRLLTDDYERRKNLLDLQLEQVSRRNAVRILRENNLFIRAEMGPYNADTETVESFTFSNYHILGDGRINRVFIFEGQAGGRTIPVDVARHLREASDEGRLAISLKIDPNEVSFSNHFTLRRRDGSSLSGSRRSSDDEPIRRREDGLVIEIRWSGKPAPHQLYLHMPEQNIWQPVFGPTP